MDMAAKTLRGGCGARRQNGAGVPSDAELQCKRIPDDDADAVAAERGDAVGGRGEDVGVFGGEVGGCVDYDVELGGDVEVGFL